MTLDEAIEVFVGGFCFTRSFTYPYISKKIGPVWVMHDEPQRSSDQARNTEWIACGISPSEMDRIAGQHFFGKYALCYARSMDQPDAPLRQEFREMGYRLGHTEPFFFHPLKKLVPTDNEYSIVRVKDQQLADKLNKSAGRKQILPAHMSDPNTPIRQYAAMNGGELIGWVKSISVGLSTWCSNLYVSPAYRRRGIGKALMTTMLAEDRMLKFRSNVLLASHTGAKLYRTLGYEQIGELFVYTPPR